MFYHLCYVFHKSPNLDFRHISKIFIINILNFQLGNVLPLSYKLYCQTPKEKKKAFRPITHVSEKITIPKHTQKQLFNSN